MIAGGGGGGFLVLAVACLVYYCSRFRHEKAATVHLLREFDEPSENLPFVGAVTECDVITEMIVRDIASTWALGSRKSGGLEDYSSFRTEVSSLPTCREDLRLDDVDDNDAYDFPDYLL